MTGMILPKHVHDAVRGKRPNQSADVVGTITRSTAGQLNSDDFVTPKGVRDQLTQLHSYVEERRGSQPSYSLPKPSGWKLMLLQLTIPTETEGGLLLSGTTVDTEALRTQQGVIIDMGVGAYEIQPERFSVQGKAEPWHKVGDRIAFVRYGASTFKLGNGQVLGLLVDTDPLMLIDSGWEVKDYGG